MSNLKNLQDRVLKFRDERDWKQFHNPKDMAISLSLESAELLEHFQWKNYKEIDIHLSKNKNMVSEELADILYWILLISADLNVDIEKVFIDKMKKNELKYPVDKAKGSHKKYTEL